MIQDASVRIVGFVYRGVDVSARFASRYSSLQFDSSFLKKRTQDFVFACGARHLGNN